MVRNRNRRPSRGGRKGKRKGLSLPVKLAIAGTALVGIVGVGAWGLNHYMSIEKIDTAFCYPRADQHQTAVFVDASVQNLTPPILRDYRSELMKAFETAPANGKVIIFTTDKEVQQTKVQPVAMLCRPAKNAVEQASINAPEVSAPMLANRLADAKKAWREKVEEVLSAVQDDQRRAGDSPILEQVREISRYPEFQGWNRKLVWISDGIQNSREGRFCSVKGQMPPHAKFAERPDYDFVKPEPFDGADVSVLLVETLKLPHTQAPFCSNTEMRKWWVDYFTANGANRVRLTPLRHWAGS